MRPTNWNERKSVQSTRLIDFVYLLSSHGGKEDEDKDRLSKGFAFAVFAEATTAERLLKHGYGITREADALMKCSASISF